MNLTQHFTTEEFNKHNFSTDEYFYNNALQIAIYLELVRQRFGKPILINSGLRSPEFNKECGGVSNSQHLYMKAVDISCALPSDYDALCFAAHITMSPESGRFIKYYSAQHFIHIHFGERGAGPLDIWQYLPFSGNQIDTLYRPADYLEDLNKEKQTIDENFENDLL